MLSLIYLVLLFLCGWFDLVQLNTFDMIKYMDEAKMNSYLLNLYVNNSVFESWDSFMVDQVSVLKEVNVVDYKVIYDSYVNIGLKTQIYNDEWLINFLRERTEEWELLELQMILDLMDVHEILDKENFEYNRN